MCIKKLGNNRFHFFVISTLFFILLAGCGSPKIISLPSEFTIENDLQFVYLPSLDIWFGRFEVSNRDFQLYHNDHTSGMKGSYDLSQPALPVVNVSWQEAMYFCKWLNNRHPLPSGFTFRLPDKLEWEAIARCDQLRKYPWGDKFPIEYGNYADNSYLQAFPLRSANPEYSPSSTNVIQYNDGYPVSKPVRDCICINGGISGLSGNVMEFSNDTRLTRGPGPAVECAIAKGASWAQGGPGRIYEISRDFIVAKDLKRNDLGFRLVVAKSSVE